MQIHKITIPLRMVKGSNLNMSSLVEAYMMVNLLMDALLCVSFFLYYVCLWTRKSNGMVDLAIE